MGIVKSVVLLMVFLNFCYVIEGCQGGGRRKKRDAPVLDFQLANFFGNCQNLNQANTGIFPSLQSVVDSVIRDSNWYNVVDTGICSGIDDEATCWISTLPLLLDSNSVFYEPTAQCICQWDSDGCWSSYAKKKRSISSEENTETQLRMKRQAPGEFTSCVDRTIKRFSRQYQSLQRFDLRSVTVFLRDHYSFCKTFPLIPRKHLCQLELLYIDKICPSTGPQSTWRRNLRDTFKAYARQDSRLGQAVRLCSESGGGGGTGASWGPWRKSSPCGVTCGEYGLQFEKRSCFLLNEQPVPAAFCQGKEKRLVRCPQPPCPPSDYPSR